MPKVVNVVGDPFSGTIETTNGTVSWSYDKYQNCCEEFGVRGDIDSLWGENIVEVRLDHNEEYGNNYATLCLYYGSSKGSSEGSLKWSPEKDDVKRDGFRITFYNDHNGYYSHDLSIFKNDKVKWNLSI